MASWRSQERREGICTTSHNHGEKEEGQLNLSPLLLLLFHCLPLQPCYISPLLFTSGGPIFRPSTLVAMLKVLFRNFLHGKKKKRTELVFFFFSDNDSHLLSDICFVLFFSQLSNSYSFGFCEDGTWLRCN